MGHIEDKSQLRIKAQRGSELSPCEDQENPFACKPIGIGKMIIAEDFYVGTNNGNSYADNSLKT
jgi:hypothetical protein